MFPTFNTAGRRRFKLSPHGINWERSEYKKKLTEFHIIIHIFDGPFKYVARIQKAHIKDCTGTRYLYVYPFCSRNGCYIYNVPTKGFVLYLLIFIYLCSSVSLIIRFLESISRVWAFLILLGYTCFYAQSIMQQAGGGRDSFTSETPSSIYNSPTYQ